VSDWGWCFEDFFGENECKEEENLPDEKLLEAECPEGEIWHIERQICGEYWD